MANISKRKFLYLVAATGLLQFVASLFYFVLLDDASVIQGLYGATKIVMFAIPLVVLYAGLRIPPFTLRSQVGRSLVWGLGSGLVMAAVILGAYVAGQTSFEAFTDPIRSKVLEIGALGVFWLVALGMSLVHSLFEEYFWRWYVVGGLSTGMSQLSAVLFGNTLFALHHYVILSQFFSWPLTLAFGTAVGLAGCVWSWVYQRTGSLLGAWVSHALADLAIFTVGYLLIT